MDKKDLRRLPKGEQTGESRTKLCDPFERETIDLKHGKLAWKDEKNKEFKLACSLTIVTLEGFQYMLWYIWERKFRKHSKAVASFRFEVFDVMARFVWNLYDEEDFENFAFTDDIFNECERIWKLVCLKGDFELDSSLSDISKYEKVREQDVCNILKWDNENKSLNNDMPKEFSSFEPKILHHHNIMEDYSGTNFMSYVRRSRDAMLPFDNLDPKGMVKQQLRMELNSGKCSCVVDALCMQSWKNINIRKLKAMECELKSLVITMHHVFYRLVSTRVGRLHICESLVTYPLSAGNIYGSWDSEVLEVVEHADLKRRSEGRRFIGTDHLVFCLHQMLLVSESVHANGKKGLRKRKKKKKAHAENSKVLWMPSDDDEEKHKDTVYHLYRKAYEIATELGHEKIGLEHLCVAITSSANDDKSSWKVSVERVRRAKKKRKCKCEEEEEEEEEDEAHPKLWKIIIGEEELGLDELVDIVKKIKDESNIPLQRAISNVLSPKVDKRSLQMSEGEMISSLKKI